MPNQQIKAEDDDYLALVSLYIMGLKRSRGEIHETISLESYGEETAERWNTYEAPDATSMPGYEPSDRAVRSAEQAPNNKPDSVPYRTLEIVLGPEALTNAADDNQEMLDLESEMLEVPVLPSEANERGWTIPNQLLRNPLFMNLENDEKSGRFSVPVEHINELNFVLEGSDADGVVAEKHAPHLYIIRRRDMRHLAFGAHVNDGVINAYFQLLQELNTYYHAHTSRARKDFPNNMKKRTVPAPGFLCCQKGAVCIPIQILLW